MSHVRLVNKILQLANAYVLIQAKIKHIKGPVQCLW